MANIDLSKYGIQNATEVVYNPDYDTLYQAELDPSLEGFEKGQKTELGAVNVMTTLPKIPSGGLLKSTRTTTNRLPRKLGNH